MRSHVGRSKTKLLRPGIEPGSSACEALVLTDIRTKLCNNRANNANKYLTLSGTNPLPASTSMVANHYLRYSSTPLSQQPP